MQTSIKANDLCQFFCQESLIYWSRKRFDASLNSSVLRKPKRASWNWICLCWACHSAWSIWRRDTGSKLYWREIILIKDIWSLKVVCSYYQIRKISGYLCWRNCAKKNCFKKGHGLLQQKYNVDICPPPPSTHPLSVLPAPWSKSLNKISESKETPTQLNI